MVIETGPPAPLVPLTPERRRLQTRRHLLEAAARVFAERGYHGATLDEVAAAAGFTKGAVYSNFKGKEDLFLSLLELRIDEDLAAVRRVRSASAVPPEARLSDFVALLHGEASTPENWGALYPEFCLYAQRHPSARERLAALDRASAHSIADLIREDEPHRAEQAEEVGRIIVALFHGIDLLRTLDPGAVDDQFMEAAVDFVARALLAD